MALVPRPPWIPLWPNSRWLLVARQQGLLCGKRRISLHSCYSALSLIVFTTWNKVLLKSSASGCIVSEGSLCFLNT
jgi:hypothetical protein